nr:LysR family transcriptional regulator [Sulfitobacter sp. SK012]
MLEFLRPLAVFSTVAECGSFRAAAERLGLSASVVSHHVSKLEDRFDVALLYRSTRKLTLTDAGAKVLEHAKHITDAGFEAVEALQTDQLRPQGKLRIATPAILEHGNFMNDVAGFLEKYPEVELDLNFSDQHVDIISEGYDLALRAGKLEDSSLMARRLASAEDVLCASPAYLAKVGRIETPGDLNKFKLIGVPSKSDVLSFRHRNDMKRKQQVKVQTSIRVNTGDAALSLAMRGVGIARVPRLLIETLPYGTLNDVLPDWALPDFEVYAVWPRNVGKRSLTRLFVDHIMSEIRSGKISK